MELDEEELLAQVAEVLNQIASESKAQRKKAVVATESEAEEEEYEPEMVEEIAIEIPAVIVLGVFPNSAGAAFPHKICGCENGVNCNHYASVVLGAYAGSVALSHADGPNAGTGLQDWKPLSEAIDGTVIITTEFVYLDKDYTLDKQYFVRTKNINICLHGHKLIFKGNAAHIELNNGWELNICDCSTNREGRILTDDNGEINSRTNGMINVVNGKLNLWNVSLDGYKMDGAQAGPVVKHTAGALQFSDVSMNNNIVDDKSPLVVANGGTFNAYGFEMKNNLSTSSLINLSGATSKFGDNLEIENNSVDNNLIEVNAANLTIMSDDSATYTNKLNNNKVKYGSLINVTGNSTLTINNKTEIKNNDVKFKSVLNAETGANIIFNNEEDDETEILVKNNYAKNSVVRKTGTGNLKVTNVKFENNGSYNGAVKAEESATVVINEGMFKDNQSGNGGALYIGKETSLIVDGTEFNGNKARYAGGALALFGNVSGAIANAKFINNEASNTKGAAAGGAIVALYKGNNGSDVTLTSCEFDGNKALNGGAIFASGVKNIENTAVTKIKVYKSSFINHSDNAYTFATSTMSQTYNTQGGVIYVAKNAECYVYEGSEFKTNFNAVHVDNGKFQVETEKYATHSDLTKDVVFTGNTGKEVIGYNLYSKTTQINLYGGYIKNNPISGVLKAATFSKVDIELGRNIYLYGNGTQVGTKEYFDLVVASHNCINVKGNVNYKITKHALVGVLGYSRTRVFNTSWKSDMIEDFSARRMLDLFKSDDTEMLPYLMGSSVYLGIKHLHTECGNTTDEYCYIHKTLHTQSNYFEIFNEFDFDTKYDGSVRYFLTKDITVSKPHAWPITVNNATLSLCLNGHKLSVAQGASLFTGAKGGFVLCDCKYNEALPQTVGAIGIATGNWITTGPIFNINGGADAEVYKLNFDGRREKKVTFINNKVTSMLRVENGSLTMEDVEIRYNKNLLFNDAMFKQVGKGDLSIKRLTVDSSKIKTAFVQKVPNDNTNKTLAGGGNVEIEAVEIKYTDAAFGAIYVDKADVATIANMRESKGNTKTSDFMDCTTNWYKNWTSDEKEYKNSGTTLTLKNINDLRTTGDLEFTGNNNNSKALNGPGALYLSNVKGKIESIKLSGNKSLSRGGALYVENNADVEIENVEAKNNEARNGGVVFIDNAKVVFKNLDFDSNKANGFGGSIYVNEGATATFENGTIKNGIATIGAAVYVKENNQVAINKINMTSNKAVEAAGALFVGQKNKVVVNDGTYDGNDAFYGGAVFARAATGSVTPSGKTLKTKTSVTLNRVIIQNGPEHTKTLRAHWESEEGYPISEQVQYKSHGSAIYSGVGATVVLSSKSTVQNNYNAVHVNSGTFETEYISLASISDSQIFTGNYGQAVIGFFSHTVARDSVVNLYGGKITGNTNLIEPESFYGACTHFVYTDDEHRALENYYKKNKEERTKYLNSITQVRLGGSVQLMDNGTNGDYNLRVPDDLIVHVEGKKENPINEKARVHVWARLKHRVYHESWTKEIVENFDNVEYDTVFFSDNPKYEAVKYNTTVYLGYKHEHVITGNTVATKAYVNNTLYKKMLWQEIFSERDFQEYEAEDVDVAFYLFNDLEITKPIPWPVTLDGKSVSLCLNGHILDLKGNTSLFKDIRGTLSICDCGYYKHKSGLAGNKTTKEACGTIKLKDYRPYDETSPISIKGAQNALWMWNVRIASHSNFDKVESLFKVEDSNAIIGDVAVIGNEGLAGKDGLFKLIGNSKIEITTISVISNYSNSSVFYIADTSAKANVEIRNFYAEDNDAVFGVVYVDGAKSLKISSVSFVANVKTGASMDVFDENFISYATNGKDNSSAALTIKNIKDTVNLGSDVKFERNTNAAGHAKNSSGALYISKTKVNITGSKFDVNMATYKGGAMSIENGAEVLIKDIVARANISRMGGFAYINNASVSIIDSELSNSAAMVSGGGVYVENKSTLKLIRTVVKAGYSANAGGAIYVKESETYFEDSLFEDNNSGINGGAIQFISARASISRTTFIDNSAYSADTYSFGGAIAANVQSTIDIVESAFDGNAAYLGGAIYVRGATVSNVGLWSKIRIASTTFVNHTFDQTYTQVATYTNAEGKAETVTIDYPTFGGAIYVDKLAYVYVEKGSNFDNNYNAVHVTGGTFETQYIENSSTDGEIYFTNNFGKAVIGYDTLDTRTRIYLYGGAIVDNVDVEGGVCFSTFSEADRLAYDLLPVAERAKVDARKVQIRLGGEIKIYNNGKTATSNFMIPSDVIVNVAGNVKYKVNERTLVHVSAPYDNRVFNLSWTKDYVDGIENFDPRDIFVSDIDPWFCYLLNRTVYIGDPHFHTVCGEESRKLCVHNHEHESVVWMKVNAEDNFDAVVEDSVYFVLNKDITVTKTHKWPEGAKNLRVGLCLNGYTLNVPAGMKLFDNIIGTFSIVDCKRDVVKTASGSSTSTWGGRILIDDSKVEHRGESLFEVSGPMNKVEVWKSRIDSSPATKLSGPLVKVNNSNLEVGNVAIEHNRFTSEDGLFKVNGNSKVKIASVTIASNSASGAIFNIQDSNKKAEVEIEELHAKETDALFGIVYIDGAKKVSIGTTSFVNNRKTTKTMDPTDENFVGYYVKDQNNSAAALTLKNIDEKVELNDTVVFDGNSNEAGHARNSAGAIYVDNTKLDLNGTVLNNNNSQYKAGAIAVLNNAVVNANGIDASGNSAGLGGFAYVNNSEFNIDESTISNAKANTSGGAIYVENKATIKVTRTRILTGTAINAGGAIYANNSTIYVEESIFNGNRAYDNAGAVKLVSAVATFSKTVFKSNRAYADNAYTFGGAIAANVESKLDIIESNFDGNEAYLGGAIYARGATVSNVGLWTRIKIASTTFANHTFNKVYTQVATYTNAEGNVEKVTIDYPTFGGALYIDKLVYAYTGVGSKFDNNYNTVHVTGGTFETQYIANSSKEGEIYFTNSKGTAVISYNTLDTQTRIYLYGGSIVGNRDVEAGVCFATFSEADRLAYDLLTPEEKAKVDAAKVQIRLGGEIKIYDNGKTATSNFMIPSDVIVNVAGNKKYKVNERTLVHVSAPYDNRVFNLSWTKEYVDGIENFDPRDIFVSDIDPWFCYLLQKTVYIGDPHFHTVCGEESRKQCIHNHSHESVVWMKVNTEDNFDAVVDDSVYFVLNKDITVTKTHKWPEGAKNLRVGLCLNGYTLTMPAGMKLFDDIIGTFSIVDCQRDVTKVASGSNVPTEGGKIVIDESNVAHRGESPFEVRRATSSVELWKLRINTSPATEKSGPLVKVDGAHLVMGNVVIENNHNLTSKDGMFSVTGNSRVRISSVAIASNSASGAIFNIQDKTKKTEITIDNIRAKENDALFGIIYVDGAKSFAIGTASFTSNIKTSQTMDPTDNRFVDYNTKGGDNSAAVLTLKNVADEVNIGKTVEFEGNENRAGHAKNSAGAIYVDNTKVNIKEVNINNNYSKYKAGALAVVNGADVTVEKVDVKGSSADLGGFAYVNGASLSIINSTISNAKAKVGGAIYAEGKAALTITRTRILSGNASNAGGAIFIKESATYIKDSIFKGNTSGDNAGAIKLISARASISRTTFKGNKAYSDRVYTYGGAIAANVESNLEVLESTFDSNEAYLGGGIYIRGATISNIGYWGKIRVASTTFINHTFDKTYTVRASYTNASGKEVSVDVDYPTLGGAIYVDKLVLEIQVLMAKSTSQITLVKQ